MILIVDDEPSALVLLEAILKRENFVVRKAASGNEALRILGRSEELCNLVISDIRMPEMDGRELVTRLRANPRLATIPVIMCTSTADRATVVDLIGHGVRDYIVKPFNATSALSRVRAVLADAEPVMEPRTQTTERLQLDPADYAPLANATLPMLDQIGVELAAALRTRDARAVRAVATRVKEPAEVFGGNRAVAAAHRVLIATGELDVLEYSGILATEVGALRSALQRVGPAAKA
jgi:DNA-binding response OmpR family regulator